MRKMKNTKFFIAIVILLLTMTINSDHVYGTNPIDKEAPNETLPDRGSESQDEITSNESIPDQTSKEETTDQNEETTTKEPEEETTLPPPPDPPKTVDDEDETTADNSQESLESHENQETTSESTNEEEIVTEESNEESSSEIESVVSRDSLSWRRPPSTVGRRYERPLKDDRTVSPNVSETMKRYIFQTLLCPFRRGLLPIQYEVNSCIFWRLFVTLIEF